MPRPGRALAPVEGRVTELHFVSKEARIGASIAPRDARDDGAVRDERFRATVARLSRQSVDKHFDAYADVAWDDPEMAIRADDQRFDITLGIYDAR